MDLDQMRRVLDELEPGMSMTIPRDWISANMPGGDETERDVNTIELVTALQCTWERDAAGSLLTFEKQPAPNKS